MFTVAEIMNTELYTLGPDDSLAAAKKLMTEHNFRHIPVVDEANQLVGVVSQRNIIAAEDSSLLPQDDHTTDNYIALASIMTENVKSVTESASLRGAALYMQQHKVGCLPVVRDDKLIGIVTDSDFVRVAINLMEQLEMVEPEDNDF